MLRTKPVPLPSLSRSEVGRGLAELGPGGHVTKILNNQSGLDVNPGGQKDFHSQVEEVSEDTSGVRLCGE